MSKGMIVATVLTLAAAVGAGASYMVVSGKYDELKAEYLPKAQQVSDEFVLKSSEKYQELKVVTSEVVSEASKAVDEKVKEAKVVIHEATAPETEVTETEV